jgi:hypothetical protein
LGIVLVTLAVAAAAAAAARRCQSPASLSSLADAQPRQGSKNESCSNDGADTNAYFGAIAEVIAVRIGSLPISLRRSTGRTVPLPSDFRTRMVIIATS